MCYILYIIYRDVMFYYYIFIRLKIARIKFIFFFKFHSKFLLYRDI